MQAVLSLLALLLPLVAAQSTGSGLDRAAKYAGKLYFGTATNPEQQSDTPYATILNTTTEFGGITPANSLKWDATEPSQNTFTFAGGDEIVNLGMQNGMLVRGHNLVWHNQLPAWVSGGTWTNETLTAVLQNHIANVAGRYSGKVYAWDVVNEPFNEDGSFGTDVFLETIGEAYIAIALRAAKEADPTAKLYINDFNIEGPGAKSTAMMNLVTKLKSQGVPIDGIGVQGHMIVGELPSGVQENLEAFTALGVEVALTELDVRMTLPSTSQLLSQQQADYTTMVGACNAVAQCVGVTVWDFTDKYSWVPGTFSGQGAACPWDENLILKPAYDGIIAGFT